MAVASKCLSFWNFVQASWVLMTDYAPFLRALRMHVRLCGHPALRARQKTRGPVALVCHEQTRLLGVLLGHGWLAAPC